MDMKFGLLRVEVWIVLSWQVGQIDHTCLGRAHAQIYLDDPVDENWLVSCVEHCVNLLKTERCLRADLKRAR